MTNIKITCLCRWFQTGGITLLLVNGSGCSLWPVSQLQECRQESNRLLSRYEVETQRSRRLESKNFELEKQVGELEKRLAIAAGAGAAPENAPKVNTLPEPSFPSSPPSITVSVGNPDDVKDSPSPVTSVSEPETQSSWRAAPKRNF